MPVLQVEYRISFYNPGSERDCADYDAATPFQTVAVGDLIAAFTFQDSPYPIENSPRLVARVTRIVRSVGRVGDKILDITLVYTEAHDET